MSEPFIVGAVRMETALLTVARTRPLPLFPAVTAGRFAAPAGAMTTEEAPLPRTPTQVPLFAA